MEKFLMQIAFLEAYILHRKNKKITIEVNFLDFKKRLMLTTAYNYAVGWCEKNNVKL
ncbi:MAG: hypothetical protein V4547_16270 [Bacteroidota bacterium]